MPPSSGLLLPPSVRDAIVRHAESAYPEECCGLLAGRRTDAGAEVVRSVAAANARCDRPRDRYAIPPEELLAAHKAARADGLEIVGYYHSHPDSPALPSGFDREHAFPGASFLIVGVPRGRVDELRSWLREDEGGEMKEESLRDSFLYPALLS